MTRADTPDIRRNHERRGHTSQTEQLIRHAFSILSACGRSMSVSKVSRVVRDYQRCVERNGWVFWDFITNEMMLTEQEKAQYEADPTIYRTITYTDRTGEDAVRNVMRELRRTS